jgi:hypothetical protein
MSYRRVISDDLQHVEVYNADGECVERIFATPERIADGLLDDLKTASAPKEKQPAAKKTAAATKKTRRTR